MTLHELLELTEEKELFVQHAAQGKHYNLQEIYDAINAEYFDNKISLRIIWFGDPDRDVRFRRILGSYSQQKQRIKIHRFLDQPDFPSYFLSYVVYHEMLHHVCPPEKGKKGRRMIHHSKFKEREKQFAHYALAKKWEKEVLKFL